MRCTYQLDYPPTVNTYWRHVGDKVLISAKGREYRQTVVADVLSAGLVRFAGPVLFKAVLHPPDRRRRDLDNTIKAMWDALSYAGVWKDDSQVQDMSARWGGIEAGGRAVIQVEDYSG